MSALRIALIAYAAILPVTAVFALALCRAAARGDAMGRPRSNSSGEKGARLWPG